MDRITLGYQVTMHSEEITSEPIDIVGVKEYLGIDFELHDSTLNSLITSVRRYAEKILSATMIDSRMITVKWQQLFGMETLPYQVIDGDISIMNLKGEPYTGVYVIDSEYGLALIKGEFPEGVMLQYRSIRIGEEYLQTIRHALVRAVAECFEDSSVSVSDAVRKNLKGFQL